MALVAPNVSDDHQVAATVTDDEASTNVVSTIVSTDEPTDESGDDVTVEIEATNDGFEVILDYFVPAREVIDPNYETIYKTESFFYPNLKDLRVRINAKLKIEKHKETGEHRLVIRDDGTGSHWATTPLFEGMPVVKRDLDLGFAIKAYVASELKDVLIVQTSAEDHKELHDELKKIVKKII